MADAVGRIGWDELGREDVGRQWTEDRARQTGEAHAQSEERGRGQRNLQRMSDMEMSGRSDGGTPAGAGKPAGGSPPGREAAAFGSDLQSSIGRQLRSMYNDLLQEPVPDRFLQLLADLDGKEAETEAGDAATGGEPATDGLSIKEGDR
ncbi:NepR family anti-sigma factor [Segnochrobactrum spirostomi]|uniref:Anti-sigma factor NepR domain-containing protein n=1 Tax=Segnochrobactrum spirostomi TaxID=2608987 RepID=A0A6A7Y7V0_9HYPH|nr:NepR family anti-sigma factor [Segnochrobactrum spirostomi]MQT14068.1 hypothetical protein [Segnochrobactrum spirostomi]